VKASVSLGLGKGFEVREVTIAEPIRREVLIDVKASGLCHSDLHLVETDFGVPMPAVFGHEIAGVVKAIGPGVTTIAVGDHVAACLVRYCGVCLECISGHSYACVNPLSTARRPGEAPRLTFADGPLNQGHGIGGFAEQVLVHENQLAVLNKQIPFAQACLLGCATATGAGAAINSANVRVGDTVAVLGTGGVGLNVISGARLAGALRVIAIDLDDAKLETAKRFGATDVINSRVVDPVSAVRELTGRGVHHAFEVVGLEVTQKQAVGMARPGGGVYFVGLAKPKSKLELPSSLEMLRAHTNVVGVHMGSTNLKRDLPMYADLYVQGRLNLDDLVTQEIALSDINRAYEQLKRGEVIRSVITQF